MKRPEEITSKLKVCDPDIRLYMIELEKENLKLHKQKAKLHVKIVSQQNEITTLKKLKPQPDVNINFFPSHNKKPLE